MSTSLLLVRMSGMSSARTITKRVSRSFKTWSALTLTIALVERRRRETINEGINEIAKIVPGCEKNKGSILQRAVSYITELTAKERSWNNERATIDVAIKELSERNNKMKANAEQAWAESNKWQKRCRDAGLHFDDYDLEIGGDEDGLGTDQ
jgi:Helix-loop-helix DNA-binding domain